MWPNAQPDGKEELVIDPSKQRDGEPLVGIWECLFAYLNFGQRCAGFLPVHSMSICVQSFYLPSFLPR